MEKLYPQVWMALPKETKLHLIKVFGLVRTGVTEVLNEEVRSDGFTEEDLKAVTLEKMIEYVGSTESFSRAWELTLAKVHSELHPPLGELTSVEGAMVVSPIQDAVIPVEEAAPVEETSAPFCEHCLAPREPHYKKCPNYTKPLQPAVHA